MFDQIISLCLAYDRSGRHCNTESQKAEKSSAWHSLYVLHVFLVYIFWSIILWQKSRREHPYQAQSSHLSEGFFLQQQYEVTLLATYRVLFYTFRHGIELYLSASPEILYAESACRAHIHKCMVWIHSLQLCLKNNYTIHRCCLP